MDHEIRSPARTAAAATLHCLTGCAIGEVLGMAVGARLGLGVTATIVLAILLAFTFGYALTMGPLLRSGLTLATALPLALASDTVSIVVMEIVDNAVVLAVPGALDAGVAEPLFWGSLAAALAVAFLAAWPVNARLIARGRGHTVVHGLHDRDDDRAHAPKPGRLAAAGLGAVALTVAVGVAGAQVAERVIV